MSRTPVLTALLAAGLIGVAAAPAQASDETLGAAITKVVPQVTPSVEAFVTTADKASSSGDLTKLGAATDDVRQAISLYKWTVVNYKASTEEGLAGKRQLLTAIREYDIGFAAYANALDKLDAGASKASTLKSLKSFSKRIKEAVKDEAAALETLGIEA